MGRTVAVIWHASFSIAAGVLYFFFVLPRWPELSGDTPHTLGTALRIVTGALIGLAALPVVFTLLRTRKPEYRTPQLALTLRLWSIILHVLAGALIVGAAISEIWLSLDAAGQWLFGIYGAAAAIAVLGIAAFYLAFVAELPPPPPRPLKSTARTRGLRKPKEEQAQPPAAEAEETATEDQAPPEEPPEEPAEVSAEQDQPTDEKQAGEEPPAAEDTLVAEPARGGLRNRRPPKIGASRWRRSGRLAT
ncbi:MAG: hypothetical protein JO044_04245 [Mycobacteriaceae bacterium]|nr:hypothetical protein [Mycobacteriaceae bacterium]MBV9641179.1 hypothetical protein [Mycobacteriaceae bacterium]